MTRDPANCRWNIPMCRSANGALVSSRSFAIWNIRTFHMADGWGDLASSGGLFRSIQPALR